MVPVVCSMSARVAGAGVDRYERAKVVPTATGFKVKMVLRPESFKKVWIGLGATKTTPAMIKAAQPIADAMNDNGRDPKRALASGHAKGYLRFQLKEPVVITAPSGSAQKFEFAVEYGKDNDLKPGDVVDLVTAWPRRMYPGDTYHHVFGMYDSPTHSNDKNALLTLPEPTKKKDAAAAKEAPKEKEPEKPAEVSKAAAQP